MILNCGTQLGGATLKYFFRIFPKRDAEHRPTTFRQKKTRKGEKNDRMGGELL